MFLLNGKVSGFKITNTNQTAWIRSSTDLKEAEVFTNLLKSLIMITDQKTEKKEDILVSIKINDKSFSVKRGPHKVSELKQLAGLPLSDELSELRNGKLIPLQDQATVAIQGGEEFFSCKREGASS